MKKIVSAERPDIFKGSFYAILAFFCMAVFGLFTKAALQGGSAVWVSFIVYLSGTLVLIPYIAKNGFSYLKSKHYPSLIGRAFFGTIASFCYTISIHYISVVNGTLLFNTAPLFIPLLAVAFLKAKIEKSTWIAVLIGFTGIIITIKPSSAIFTQMGSLIGVFSGFSLAIAYLLMKLLTETDQGVRIIFYYLGIGMLLQIPALFFTAPLPSMDSCFYSILGGMFLLIAQLALVKGYKYAEASQVGIYQYLSVVFVGLFEWLFWGKVPTNAEIIGIILVALAGIIIIKNGNNKMKQERFPDNA